MKAFMIQLGIQFKCDMRDKGVLLVYYLVPLVMYFVLGATMGAMSLGNGNFSLAAVACIFTISMAAYLGLPQTLVKARETGVLNAYKAAGIPAWSYLLSNVLIAFLHMILLCIVITLTAPYVFDVPHITNYPQFFGVIALTIAASAALGTVLGAVVKKQALVGVVGQILFLPSIMFSGTMFPADLLPEGLRAVGKVLPATQGQAVLNGTDVAWNVALLVIIAAAGFLVAVQLFRRMGKKQ